MKKPACAIKLTAFRWIFPSVHGYVRDFRIRWALEELGITYEENLIEVADLESPAYLRQHHPFGMVPAYEEDGVRMFESGAILMHLAEKSEMLMPRDPAGRARVQCWMFAALNSIEPLIMNLVEIDFFCEGEEWSKLRRPDAVKAVKDRLSDLSNWLEGREYLEDRFTVADLLMASVLRSHDDLLDGMPVLAAYYKRCLDRPAFKKAVADQIATFARNKPANSTTQG